MTIKDITIQLKASGQDDDTSLSLYAIGDVHMGALNCGEDQLRRLVERIRANPNARWVGGGDLVDAVVIGDVKRFDVSNIPAWMIEGLDVAEIRDNLSDIVDTQVNRLCKMLAPIRKQCLGLIEGNHEYAIVHHHNRNVQKMICEKLGAENLTDCSFMRLNLSLHGVKSSVRVFIAHGNGGGRTSGAEPNALYRLAADKDVDIVLRGHSHTFCIHPPIPVLGVPDRGRIGQALACQDKFACNWGTFMLGYVPGPSTYASRACYPARPLYTAEIQIKPPFGTNAAPAITMSQISL